MSKIKFTMPIALDKSLRRIDENGFLHVESSHITKATVNPYYGHEIPDYQELGLNPEKIYYGFRDPEELKKSLHTWSGLPLHFEHHTDSADNPQKEHRVGAIGTDIKWNDPYIDAPLVVWDQDAIDSIKDSTFKEISCAYWYKPEIKSGTFNGEHYDFIMRNIRGNHVALVEDGRAGHDVAVADAALKKTGANMADEEKKEGQNTPSFKEAMDKCGLDSDDEAQAKAFAEGVKFAKEEIEAAETTQTTDEDETKDKTESTQDEDETNKESTSTQDEDETKEDSTTTQDEDETKDVPANDDEILAKIFEAVPDLTDTQKSAIKALFDAQNQAGDEDTEEKTDKTDATDEEAESTEQAKDKALKKRKILTANDAAIIKAQATKRALQTLRQIDFAVQKVIPLVGKMNTIAFDSASGVYKAALKQLGKKPESYPKQAWEGMIDILLQEKINQSSFMQLAKDSKPIPDQGPFSHLKKIHLSR